MPKEEVNIESEDSVKTKIPPWHSDLPNPTPIDFNAIKYHPNVQNQRIRVLKGELKQTNGGLHRKDLIVVLNKNQDTIMRVKTHRMRNKGRAIYSKLLESGKPLVPNKATKLIPTNYQEFPHNKEDLV